MIEERGTLFGVGVGPGDPELMTMKAIRVLKGVAHIFAARSSKNDYSLASAVVKQHLNGARIEPLSFPMTRKTEVLQEAWNLNAGRVLEVLREGEDAAFVTLGDPMTYSTYGYLLRTMRLLDPHIEIRTIPGVTSYNAAAALANLTLAEGEESCYLISGAMGGDRLRQVINSTENVVMLKAYRRFDDIYETLRDLDLLDRATCISCCGLEGETVVEDVQSLVGREMPYLSLIIIKKPEGKRS